jgi:hypothetical protein
MSFRSRVAILLSEPEQDFTGGEFHTLGVIFHNAT